MERANQCLNGVRENRQQCRAFTLVELLVVIAVVGILAALLLPALTTAKARSKTVACISQLKQIGVASIAFAGDNNERLPAATMPNTNRTLNPLQAVSRELGSLRIFLCPADSERIAGTNLTSLDRSNTSYFVSYSARTDQPQSIVAGDRNITLITATPGVPGGVPGRITGAMKLFRTNSFGWWRDMHQGKGNLLLADGSVHITNARKLDAQIAAQPHPSFDWYMPNGDSIFTPFP
jgi:prepilin-type N-terminal cleavage/methylation domain-containing protein/prepilin-type processing-associated H-X9-DG protein